MGCGEPTLAENPFAGLPSGSMPGTIDFDDRRVEVTTDLTFGAPNVVLGGAGVEVCNESTGSRARAGLSATSSSVDPNRFAVGPAFGWGGLSMGILASGLFKGNPSFTPQIGIGGTTFSPGLGVCSGFWCVGGSGAGLLPPAAIAIIGASQVVGDVLQIERENAEGLPLLIATDLVSNLLPFRQLGETLNTVGLGTGTGPVPRTIETVEELAAFRAEIERTVESGRWTDARRSLEEGLRRNANPFVRAELRELLDRARFEENGRGIPSQAVERNIRDAVDALDQFAAEHRPWLLTGAGTAPDGRELDAYLGDALYLMRKSHFTVEPVEKDGRLTLKIRKSSPFQIGDPELAVRYLEGVARFLEALAQEKSGLVIELARRTESTTRGLLSTLGGDSKDPREILRHEAERAWHLSLVQTVALLYQQGFYHRRLGHIRWMVTRGGGDPDGSLAKRLDSLPHPEMGQFAAAVRGMTETPLLTPEDYRPLQIGLDAIRAVDRLKQESFPDWLGDGSLLFDRERARQWGMRLEIIDGIYRLAAVHQIFLTPEIRSQPPRHLLTLLRTAERDLVAVLQDNRAEASREWHRYRLGFPQQTQGNLSGRLRDLEEVLEEIDPTEINAALGRLEPDGRREAAARREDLKGAIASTRRQASALAEESRRFRTDGFSGFPVLFEGEARESSRVNAFFAEFHQRLLPAYEAFKMRLAHSPLRDDREVQKYFKEWEKSLQKATTHLEWARRDYERFNARRVGRYFLDHYLTLANIDPTEIPDSGPFF